MNLGDLEFKPEDFDGKVLDLDIDGDRKFILCYRDAECIAEIVNSRLRERLEKAPQFFAACGGFHPPYEATWFSQPDRHSNVQARLVCLEEIKS